VYPICLHLRCRCACLLGGGPPTGGTHFESNANHLPEGITDPLTSSGGSEVLGPWANYVDQDKTNFENLRDVVLLYLP
jgi:hypothetical protein